MVQLQRFKRCDVHQPWADAVRGFALAALDPGWSGGPRQRRADQQADTRQSLAGLIHPGDTRHCLP